MNALPIPNLKSRLSTSIIFSYQDRRKAVVKLLLILCHSGRAFVITQDGLKGFLMTNHDNIASWLIELRLSRTFRKQIECFETQAEVDDLDATIQKCSTLKEKE